MALAATVVRVFVLRREEDVTGVSGTGVVAEGIEFADGRVALRWCVGEHRSTVAWDSIDAVRAIHGHDGKTRVEWIGGTLVNGTLLERAKVT